MASSNKTTNTPAPDAPVGDTTQATSPGEVDLSNEVLAKSGEDLAQAATAATGSFGESRPTMVNGKFVGDKKFNEATGEWEADPDAAAAEDAPRVEDIFDRIGNAFTHEAQRLVIEEIALRAGITAGGSQTLPENMPTGGKSTASMRTDLTGRGAFAGGRGTSGEVVPAATSDDAQA